MNRLRDFFAAVSFLTVLPVKHRAAFHPERMPPFFPLVGLMLGALLYLVDWAASALWPQSVAALLDVVFLAVLTGGLHIDGLGDAADGMLGHRSAPEALAVMKDSRIGVMGLLAIVGTLSIKWAGLSHLSNRPGLFLILIPSLARGAMLFGIRGLPYGRPQGGTGQPFFATQLPGRAFWSIALLAAALATAGARGLVLIVCYAGLNAILLAYYRKRIGAVTGDMLGAMTELNEAILFLVAAVG